MIVKFLSNITAKLYIDQEEMTLLEAGKIYKCHMEVGSYLLEVMPLDDSISPYVEDYELSEDKQTLKRIDFGKHSHLVNASLNDNSASNIESLDVDVKFEDFNERGIAVKKRYGIERFVTINGKVWIVNESDCISAANEDKYTLDGQRYDWCGRLERSSIEKGLAFLPVVKNGEWGVCEIGTSSKWNQLIPCKYDQILSVYPDWKLAVCRKSNHIVLVNLNGNIYASNHELSGQYVVAPVGEELSKVLCDNLYPIVRLEQHSRLSEWSMRVLYWELYFPHSAVIVENGKYGINHLSNHKPKLIYDDVFSKDQDGKTTRIFHEHMPLIARKGNKFGLVDSIGLELTTFIYDDICFVGEIVVAKIEGGYLLLDRKGQKLISKSFDSVRCEDETYIVKINEKCGVYSLDLNSLILPCKYDSITSIEYDVKEELEIVTVYAYLCEENGRYGVYGKNGDCIVECKYEEIRPLEKCSSGIDLYGGYILKYNGRYGWTVNYLGVVSKCIYEDIITATDHNCTAYHIVKNTKWGCFTHTGEQIFDFEYDSIRSLGQMEINGEYLMSFLCSREGRTYLIDSDNVIHNELDYEDVEVCGNGFYIVKKNGLYGLIYNLGYPSVFVKCEYDSLNIMTIGDKYIYVQGNIKGVKYVIMCSKRRFELNKVFAIDCDDIYPVLDSVQLNNVHTYYHNDRDAYVFVKNGKQGVVDLNGEIIVPALYDEIVQVEKDEQNRIAYFVTKQNDKLAVFDTKRRCIIPPAYDKIRFVKNYFIVKTEKYAGTYSADGRMLLPCIFDDYACLTSYQSDVFTELKKKPEPEPEGWYNDIPISLWRAGYNTFVAFNSESGSVIVDKPIEFDRIKEVLMNYKERYLIKM